MRRKLLMAVVAAATLVATVVSSGPPAMAQQGSQQDQQTPAAGTETEDIGNTSPGAVSGDQVLSQQSQVGAVSQGVGAQVAPAQGGFSQIESAQIEQSEAESQPATSETNQLVTSSTEVRRAVVGLVALAVVTALLTALYWYKTGQQARERHQRQFGGRHRADLHGPVVQDERGPWANDALNWNAEPQRSGSSTAADAPVGGVAVQERPVSPPYPDAPTPHPGESRPWGSGKPTWPPTSPQATPPA